MYTPSRRNPRLEIDVECILLVLSLFNNPIDVIRATAVSHLWRRLVVEKGLCKRIFMESFPRVTHAAYEVEGRYQIIRLSDVLSGDAANWQDLERDHKIYSYLLQPRLKRMDCPRDCLLFPVGDSSKPGVVEDILTNTNPVCSYPVGFSFLSSEEQSETRIDFVKYLGSDVCTSLMSFLDDPADIVRFSVVSRFWREFAIANQCAKQLCLKAIPQLSTIAGVVVIGSKEAQRTSIAMKTEFLERDHRVYAPLIHAVTKSKAVSGNCLKYAVCASSTDNFPLGSILNTMRFGDNRHLQRDYWSSKGQSNPEVPETLIYKLRTGLSIITEIDIKPCRASFSYGRPYSAKSVRFRMGHPKSAKGISTGPESFPLANPIDDEFVWTYTSPGFPMVQETILQQFKLPEPALCFGGYVQIELLGKVERQETDGLFYICLNLVRVVGRSLFPAFDTEIRRPSGEIWLRYNPEFLSSMLKNYWLIERMVERMDLLEAMPLTNPLHMFERR